MYLCRAMYLAKWMKVCVNLDACNVSSQGEEDDSGVFEIGDEEDEDDDDDDDEGGRWMMTLGDV